jgi:hypothetical protein
MRLQRLDIATAAYAVRKRISKSKATDWRLM